MPKVSLAKAKKRIEVLIKEAENGDTDSMRLLADIYSDGEYAPKDDFAAEAWLRKAAELGDDEAYFRLAEMLKNCKGVAQNLTEAFNIFHELAFDGNADAIVETGKALIEGKGVEKNKEQGEFYLNFGKSVIEDITEDEKRAEKMYEDLKFKKK